MNLLIHTSVIYFNKNMQLVYSKILIYFSVKLIIIIIISNIYCLKIKEVGI